jgi:hypothetical protein
VEATKVAAWFLEWQQKIDKLTVERFTALGEQLAPIVSAGQQQPPARG